MPCLIIGELLFCQSPPEVRGCEDWIGLLLGGAPRALPAPAVVPLLFEEARMTELEPWALSGRRPPVLEWLMLWVAGPARMEVIRSSSILFALSISLHRSIIFKSYKTISQHISKSRTFYNHFLFTLDNWVLIRTRQVIIYHRATF